MLKKNVKRIIGIILVIILSINFPMNVNAKTQTNAVLLLDYALDGTYHLPIVIEATTDMYTQEYMDTVGSWAINSFNSWAFDNLKFPQSAVINKVEVALFSYQLAYPDMSTAYTGFINDMMIGGVKPETLQAIGYVVSIDYSAQNSFGGYVRNTLYGAISADGTGYNLGKLTLLNDIPTMAYYCLGYSGNPIMTWK